MKRLSLTIPILLFFTIFSVQSGLSQSARSAENPDAWEERANSIQPPEKVMDTIGLKPGMIIAEVGAGRGRYVVHLSKRVGEKGFVYANDINTNSLNYLEYRCKRDGIRNVKAIYGEVTDPKLPEGKLDLVFMINTYHHLEKPVELLRNIIPGLKPGGRLAIVEGDLDKTTSKTHATNKDKLIKEVSEAGFELIKMETFLIRDNIYIFKIKNKP